MKILIILQIALILFCSAGCLPSLLSKEEASNYFSEGFISPHCYQVLINKTPEKKNSGLVDSRESAYFQARKEIKKQAEKSLINFILKERCGITNMDKYQESDQDIDLAYFKKKTAGYMDSGKTVEEYYKKDKSVVLVYRITERNLQNKIASLKCKKIKSTVTGE